MTHAQHHTVYEIKCGWMCHVIAAIACIVVLGPLTWWTVDRRPPVEVTDARIEPNVVSPGQSVDIIWEAKRIRYGCEGRVRRRVVDSSGVVIVYTPVQTVYHNDDVGTYKRDFTVPMRISPGVAYHEVIREYWCNPVQEYIWPIVITGNRVPFVVKHTADNYP